jgi:hypothetical protein
MKEINFLEIDIQNDSQIEDIIDDSPSKNQLDYEKKEESERFALFSCKE